MRQAARGLLAAACLLLTAGGALHSQNPSPPNAQQPQQPPTFRGGANFVYVDVYPRRDGRLIDDLRAEDFQVFEDGKPQHVQTFEFIRFQTNTPEGERRDPNTKEESERLAADPRNRVFVIYLDIYHTTFVGAHETKGPLLEFLDRTLGANDLFGVMTPETPVQQLTFARNTETIRDELTNHFDWALGDPGRPVSPRDPTEERLWMCGPDPDPLIRLYREDVFATSLKSLMIYLRDLRDERKNLVLVTEGWFWSSRPTAPAPVGRPEPPRIGPGPGGRLGVGVPEFGTLGNDSFCNSMVARLSGIDFDERFRELLRLANQANVSVYPFDVGGLRTEPGFEASRGGRGPTPAQLQQEHDLMRGRMDTLMTLAENTDGRAIVNTNDMYGGFKQVSDDLSGYYLLGYPSSNTGLDGKYHRIDVKVARPRVSVTARKGYLAAVPDTRPASMTPAAPEPITLELGRLARLRSDADLFTYAVPSSGGLDVVVELPSAQVGTTRWSRGAAVDVIASSAGLADLTAQGRIDPGLRATVVHLAVSDPKATWQLTVRARGDDSVEDRLAVAPASAGLTGAAISFRGSSSPRGAVQPVADFQFRRSERLHVEWPIVRPLDQRSARLLDRRGQPLPIPVALTERESNGRPILAADLQLAPLGEADYVLELTTGSGGVSERQYVAFRVVR